MKAPAADRARIHAALGNHHRLDIVDALALGDRTVADLRRLTNLPGNLLAHHLDVLQSVALIERRRSEGDHRRRYVVLRPHPLVRLDIPRLTPGRPLFVCTHNSARSQFAAALWQLRTGGEAQSAGTHPAERVHPEAVRAAAGLGVDLSGAMPADYEAIAGPVDLVVSVCDRAGEAPPPPGSAPRLHWSVPDPVLAGSGAAFRRSFVEIAERIDRLAAAGAK